MRAALERLLCRTKHKWSIWDAEDKENINRHCLRTSCDVVQKINYLEYITLQAFTKMLLRRAMPKRIKFANIKGGTIRFKRYGHTQAVKDAQEKAK